MRWMCVLGPSPNLDLATALPDPLGVNATLDPSARMKVSLSSGTGVQPRGVVAVLSWTFDQFVYSWYVATPGGPITLPQIPGGLPILAGTGMSVILMPIDVSSWDAAAFRRDHLPLASWQISGRNLPMPTYGPNAVMRLTYKQTTVTVGAP